MQEMFLGTAIRQRRLELGLTQERLCEGICEPITISRLENGKQTPSRNRINAILERLDMPSDRFYALLSKNELELEEKQKQIVGFNLQFGQARDENKMEIRAMALEAHHELEAIMEDDDMISRQLLLRSRIILGKDDGSRFNLEERKSMLLEAIRLTSPAFDLDEIGQGLYTVEEIKIINQIATAYGRAGEHMDAIGILNQLYKYIRKHFQNMPVYQAHFQMIAFNYSKELLWVGQYSKAIEVAEEGIGICINYGSYLSLPGLLAIKAEAYHFLEQDHKSRDLYRQSYYLYKAIGDESNRECICADAKKYLGLVFDD